MNIIKSNYCDASLTIKKKGRIQKEFRNETQILLKLSLNLEM